MFVTWYMKEWVEGMFLANFFFSELHSSVLLSEGKHNPCHYWISFTLIQAIPADWLDCFVFLSSSIGRAQQLGIIGWTLQISSPSIVSFTNLLSNTEEGPSIPSSAWLLICGWKAESIMIQRGILLQFWDLTLKIITYSTLNLCSLP